MNLIYSSYSHKLQTIPTNTSRKIRSITLLILTPILLVLLLTGCSTLAGGGDTQSQPEQANVNIFGTAANHVHSLVALPNNVLLLATHFGLFRSADGGQHWALVAAGPDQGMMTNWLAASPLNQQRLYVMTFPALVTTLKGTLGLYTSADEGRTWKLAITSAKLGNDNFIVQPGNQSPEQVYVYVNVLGTKGLKVSNDAGQHFTTPGTLPFGNVQGLFVLPGAPGTLLAYGDQGAARSTDGGVHWEIIPSLNQQAVFGLTTGGPNRPIYASADQGIYVSQDGGKTFALVHPGASYSSLTASPVNPQLVYGKTSSTIFRSTDGGHTWNALPPPTGSKGSLYALVADPTNSAVLYLGLSYPTEVYRYDQDSSKSWTSLTPQAEQQANSSLNGSMSLVIVLIILVVLVALIMILLKRYSKAYLKSRKR
jgi:photosystem II stability/assembly factor-like uncharacterized protein